MRAPVVVCDARTKPMDGRKVHVSKVTSAPSDAHVFYVDFESCDRARAITELPSYHHYHCGGECSGGAVIGGDGKRAAKAAPAARLLIALATHYVSQTNFFSACLSLFLYSSLYCDAPILWGGDGRTHHSSRIN